MGVFRRLPGSSGTETELAESVTAASEQRNRKLAPHSVTTSSTASRALACGSRQARAKPAQRSGTEGAECRRWKRGECERDHQGRARASAGNGRGLSAPVASAEPRPLVREHCRARRAAAGRLSRFSQAVVARRHVGLRHRASPTSARNPSNGADDSFAVAERRIGRSLRSRPFGMAQAPP
jgi:hypothetical protein